MYTLQSVQVDRFKCIRSAPFDLGPVNILVGANNSGKSSVIQALHFGIGLLQTIRLLGRWPSGSKKTLSTSLSPNQLVYAPSEAVASLGAGGNLKEPEESAIRISLTFTDGEVCTIAVRKGRNRNILITVDNVERARQLSKLDRPFSIFSPGLAGVAKTEQYVSDGVLLRTIARGDANLVLRNTLYRLWDTPGWDAFHNDLLQIFPGIAFRVSFLEQTDEFITVEVRLDGPWVPLELAGTGVLQATQILSYIHAFSPSLVVLDEPDSHLHPNNQRLLCALLRLIAEERQTQVLLTTHSRHVVDAIGGTSRFLWVRDGTVDTADVDDEIGVLLDIGALDIKERAARGHAKAIVLTEDERVQPLVTLLESSGFDPKGTVVLPYHGCTSIKNLRPLVRIITQANPSASIIVHRDRDYLTDDEVRDWEVGVRRLSVSPFVTDVVDVEGHFISSEHLAALNFLKPDVFTALIDAATEEAKEISTEKYVNSRVDIERKAGRGGSINYGRLSTEATKALEGDTERYRYGKKTLAMVRRLFREAHSRELVVMKPTEHLSNPILGVAAAKAFGSREDKPAEQDHNSVATEIGVAVS